MATENIFPPKGGGGGAGDVTGPVSSTDNAIVLFDGTSGTALKNSPVTIDTVSGNVTVPALATIDGRDVSVDGATLDAVATTYIPLTQKAAANGVATLDAGGQIPSAQLPPIAITDTFVVASQAAQVALTAEVGDVAVRTDLNKSYILRVAPASVFANWQELLTPTDTVTSVNGQTGTVSLTKSDVGLGNVDNTSDATKDAALTTLTNKTISGSANSITDISFSAINAFSSAALLGKLTSSTGTGVAVFDTSPTLVTPALGTPTAAVLTNATGLPLSTGITGNLPIGNGGTGQTTANAAFNALAPSQSGASGKILRSNGTDTSFEYGFGLVPVTTATAVATAVPGTMYSCTSTGGFTITLPTIPALGAVIGVMDAGETCSATNFIRVAPATGQSIDGYPANDTLTLDYVRANAVFYAAPGATSWKVQYQATSMVQGGQLPGQLSGTAIGTGFVGERIDSAALGNSTLVTDVDKGVGSITLNKGIYMVYARVRTIPGTTTHTYTNVGISRTFNAQEQPHYVSDYSTNVTASRYQQVFKQETITADATPVYLTVTAGFTGTAASFAAAQSIFYAIRIA